MEHNAIQWLGAPSCQRGSYSFYKSVGSRTRPDGPVQTWRLGEFYFIRCGPEEPVCLAEVTLLWEDQTQRHLLASARLYFLPEDTPKGRTRDHGEDEVLAVSRKMVVKVEDLVRWSCSEENAWKVPNVRTVNGINGVNVVLRDPQSPNQDPAQTQDQKESEERTQKQTQEQDVKEKEEELKVKEEEELKTQEAELKTREVELKTPDVAKEEITNKQTELKTEEAGLKAEGAELKTEEAELKTEGEELKKTEETELKMEKIEESVSVRQWVKVLSYPQYCRFRSLQRRTYSGAAGLELQDPLVLALGGLKVALSNTRVMYCRDTFHHPTLESNVSFTWQFTGCPSLSLRGRPRKRKGRDGKDSPTSGQSESWIDRMQENVMGSVETGLEGAWLPHPDEQFFLDQLFSFMDKQGAPIHKVPNLGFKKIDLFRMYSVVKRLGGYEQVTNDRLWKIVYNELGGCPAAPAPPRAPADTTNIVNPDGTVVVKRGRGRPPGKKNKSTLIAQAKLLAQQQGKGRVVTVETRPGLGIRTGVGRGRPSAHPSLHRVPPLHTPQPIAPALIPVNMPLTPDLSPRSAPFISFQTKPHERPDSSSSTNSTSSTNTPTTTTAPPQGLLLSAIPHHFVTGFSPIKGLCSLDVFRNRNQQQDASQHIQPQQHQIIYSIQPKMAENAQAQNQEVNRNRLPLPRAQSAPVRQLMRTRLGSTQFQTFTRRLSEALSHDGASKPVPCSPITPPPEQNLPLNLSKRLPQKRGHAERAEPSDTGSDGRRRAASAGGTSRPQLSSRIRAFLLGLPPFQVKLEEDLNGARFPKLIRNPGVCHSQICPVSPVENLGMKRQDDDVIIVEDDRDDEDEEEQEAVVFVKEEFHGKEVKGVQTDFGNAAKYDVTVKNVTGSLATAIASSLDAAGLDTEVVS
ncbi:hypothetical protein WMY93_007325 [Mugilogobius chulae]|uniref:ARID domain-containing protein n=1 Tax=Mugilogobius chulae TaxID=88201 RepID=A0AAW0PGC5_9GOBI